MNMEWNSIHLPNQSITMPSLLVHKMAFNTQKPEPNTNTLPVDQTGLSIVEASQLSSQDHQILLDRDLLVGLFIREDPTTR